MSTHRKHKKGGRAPIQPIPRLTDDNESKTGQEGIQLREHHRQERGDAPDL